MSGIATVAKAWGADVAGSDSAASTTTERLVEAGIPVTIGHAESNVPDGFEIVASSAIPPDNPELAAGTVFRRATLLAQLLDQGRSIVVAGAHGKTTTASMIAYCLDRLGDDPTFIIGGDVPQLGTNARAGKGWIVAEGDESDGSLLELAPSIAVITNVDHDHHSTFASRAEVENLFGRWLAGRAAEASVVHGEQTDLGEAVELAVPGEHNRTNAACAVDALVRAGFERREVERVIRDFTGVGRRLESHGEAAGVSLYDDYAHHPVEVEATLKAARSLVRGGRLVALFQPHLFSRTEHLAHEFGVALCLADAVCVTDIYPARELPREGVTAKLVVDAIARNCPGMLVGLAPDLSDAADLLVTWLREGDTVLALGAGDVYRALPMIAERYR